jgi:hypothetical protein
MLVYQDSNYITIELENYEDFTTALANAKNSGPSIHVSIFNNYIKIDLDKTKNMTVEELNKLVLVNDLNIISCLVSLNRFTNNELWVYFMPSRDISEYKFLPSERKFKLNTVKPEITNTNELINKHLSFDIVKGILSIY